MHIFSGEQLQNTVRNCYRPLVLYCIEVQYKLTRSMFFTSWLFQALPMGFQCHSTLQYQEESGFKSVANSFHQSGYRQPRYTDSMELSDQSALEEDSNSQYLKHQSKFGNNITVSNLHTDQNLVMTWLKHFFSLNESLVILVSTKVKNFVHFLH